MEALHKAQSLFQLTLETPSLGCVWTAEKESRVQRIIHCTLRSMSEMDSVNWSLRFLAVFGHCKTGPDKQFGQDANFQMSNIRLDCPLRLHLAL